MILNNSMVMKTVMATKKMTQRLLLNLMLNLMLMVQSEQSMDLLEAEHSKWKPQESAKKREKKKSMAVKRYSLVSEAKMSFLMMEEDRKTHFGVEKKKQRVSGHVVVEELPDDVVQ